VSAEGENADILTAGSLETVRDRPASAILATSADAASTYGTSTGTPKCRDQTLPQSSDSVHGQAGR
jgi:hypothetical protein